MDRSMTGRDSACWKPLLTPELVWCGQAAQQGASKPELVEIRSVLEELGGQGGADLVSSA